MWRFMRAFSTSGGTALSGRTEAVATLPRWPRGNDNASRACAVALGAVVTYVVDGGVWGGVRGRQGRGTGEPEDDGGV